MNENEIIDLKKFQTWLKISMDIGKVNTFESWRTIGLIDAVLSCDKFPETFYIKDILKFLDINDNKKLLEYMKIHCCSGWPIKEEDMLHADHIFSYRLLPEVCNYGGKKRSFREHTSYNHSYNEDLLCGLNLYAFYKDFFIGEDYHLMSICKKFVDLVDIKDIDFSEPLVLDLCQTNKVSDYLDHILFDCNASNYCHGPLDSHKGINYDFIEKSTKKLYDNYAQRILSSKSRIQPTKNYIRTLLYSKWNFRFKIEDDGGIFLFDFSYIADEVVYKNIFHKIIGKKTYRPKNYTKDFNLKMTFSEFQNFSNNFREYVNYDSGTIKIMMY